MSLSILTTPGYDLSVPIVYDTVSNGSKKFQRPTSDAVRMANALILERVPGKGQFKNAFRLASQIDTSKNVLPVLPAMLNKPVREIERLPFTGAPVRK